MGAIARPLEQHVWQLRTPRFAARKGLAQAHAALWLRRVLPGEPELGVGQLKNRGTTCSHWAPASDQLDPAICELLIWKKNSHTLTNSPPRRDGIPDALKLDRPEIMLLFSFMMGRRGQGL